MNNKISFINDLLSSSRITVDDKTRILNLTKNELNSFDADNLALKERVENIEKRISEIVHGQKGEATIIIDKDHPIPEINLPKTYYDPKYLYDFLLDYNQNPFLRTTCHLIDTEELMSLNNNLNLEQYSFNTHKEKVIESFINLVSKYKSKKEFILINYKTLALIRGFLTGKDIQGNIISKGWSENILINWDSQELLIWSKENEGFPPNPDQDIINNSGNIGFSNFEEFIPNLKLLEEEGIVINNIQTFSQLVSYFKYLFHIRADNSLKKILQNNISENFINQIDFDFSGIEENLEFFTDVSKLIQAFNGFIKLILKIKEEHKLPKPQVEVKFYSNNGYYFSIYHKNTTFKKDKEIISQRVGQSFANLIDNQINGIADFFIKANLNGKESYKIEYWSYKIKTDRKPCLVKIEEFKGVEYILKLKA